MKKLNKILAFALTLALCINLCVPAFAAADDSVPEEHIKAIENALLGISPEKEVYGLGDVDFSNLWIGNEIPKYEFTNNGLCKIEEFLTYPILDENEKIVALANISRDNVETSASVSCELAEDLNTYSNRDNTEICLVYDNTAVYCWDRETHTKLSEYYIRIDNRDSASWDKLKQYDISTCKVEKKEFISISERINPIGYDDESIYLTVDKILQPYGSAWCWAAGIACVVNYIRDTDYRCRDIAKMYTENFNAGIYPEDFIKFLDRDFHILYSLIDGSYGKVRTIPVFKSLQMGYPVIGFFNANDRNHAVIIRGVDFQSATFSLMNPITGDYEVGSMTPVSSGNANFNFASTVAGVRWTMYNAAVDVLSAR